MYTGTGTEGQEQALGHTVSAQLKTGELTIVFALESLLAEYTHFFIM